MKKLHEDLKSIVKEKYSDVVSQSELSEQQSCCGASPCSNALEVTMIGDDYKNVSGYNPDADLGLGCGLPTEFAAIKEGDSVLDLGSGAGNDCFVARSIVGEKGKVTGLDFTDAMLQKARLNLEKTGFANIDFVQGDIENMPLPENSYDVVISNCVLNLVPDKRKAFSEIFRVLKPGGHFCISDIVLLGNLPEKLQQAAEMYAECVSGALQRSEYLEIIKTVGFSDIQTHKEKPIVIPDSILLNYLAPEELSEIKSKEVEILSITVSATKQG